VPGDGEHHKRRKRSPSKDSAGELAVVEETDEESDSSAHARERAKKKKTLKAKRLNAAGAGVPALVLTLYLSLGALSTLAYTPKVPAPTPDELQLRKLEAVANYSAPSPQVLPALILYSRTIPYHSSLFHYYFINIQLHVRWGY